MNEESEVSSDLDPNDIFLIGGEDLITKPYDEAAQELTAYFEGNTWTDPEVAAQNYAKRMDNLNRYHDINPEVTLNTDAIHLSNRLLDKNLTEDDKIDAIEEWRTTAKEELYNSNDTVKLAGAYKTEKVIDEYATQLRRGVVAGDIGFIIDSIARGLEDSLGPLVGTADVAFGTNLEASFRDTLKDYENPDSDNSIKAIASSMLGTIGGFALSSLNPVTAYGYLASQLIGQGKRVYDETLKETNSLEAATEALTNSSPGILLGTFADKLVGGALGATLKGQKGYIGTLTGLAAGAAGNTAQSLITAESLVKATGEEKFNPTSEQVLKEALVGGVVGGIVGAAHDINLTPQQKAVKALHKQLKETLNKNAGAEDSTVANSTTQDNTNYNFFDEVVAKENVTDSQTFTSESEVSSEAAYAGEVAKIVSDFAIDRDVPKKVTVDDSFQVDSDKKILSIAPETGYTPLPFIYGLIEDLGSSTLLRKLNQSAGMHVSPTDDSSAGVVILDRPIFKDQEQAKRTYAHEFGHLIDTLGRMSDKELGAVLDNKRVEDVLNKFVRLYNGTRKQFKTEVVAQEAKKLSEDWRPVPEGAAGGYIAYRNRTNEIHADAVSAILNNPQYVQTNYPAVWEAFTKGLDTQPTIKKFWEDVQEINTNPDKLFDWEASRAEEGRVRQAKIEQQTAQEALNQAENLPKKAKFDIRRKVINRFGIARDIVAKVGADKKEKVTSDYNSLFANITGFQQVHALLHQPVTALINKFKALKLTDNDTESFKLWKEFETNNRILNETTDVIERVGTHPEEYRQAFQQLNDYLDLNYSKFNLNRNPLANIDISELEGKALRDSFAKAQYDFPEASRLALIKRLTKLAEVQEEPTPDNLAASQILSNSRILELLNPNSFNVRRYLGNPGARLEETALKNMGVIRNRLGEERFNQLKEVSQQFHDIIGNYMYDTLQKSGRVSDDLLARLKLNKNNWVNFNILKYFEQDPTFSGTMHKQYGTLEKQGDVLASTINKAEAVVGLAQYQIAQNAAINIARAGDYSVTEVPARGNVYDLKNKLQSKDSNNSYMIEFEQGKPTLYKINSPEFSKMFESSSWLEGSAGQLCLNLIESYNKLFLEREMKTLLSLPYAISSKAYDIANESILARSRELPIPFIHLDKRLRNIRKQGIKLANEVMKARETGDVFPATVKEMFDENALAAHMLSDYGGESDASLRADNAIYEELGISIPAEDQSIPTRFNLWANKKLENFGFGEFKPFKLTKKLAERDELAAKITAYLIGKDVRGLSKPEAALIAREYAGTPDPFGGGAEAAKINKLFLFGRAHINGMRAIFNQFKEDPRGFGTQYVYRKLVPRLMASGAIMAPLISALFGDEEGEKARKLLNKIPEFDKVSKNIIPFGFIDDKGKHVGYGIDPKKVNRDYKASYIAAPVARELVSLDTFTNVGIRALEELIDTGGISAKHIAQDTAKAFSSVGGGSFAPLVMGSLRTAQLASGGNPYDYYRNKGILPKDVAEAGTFLEKFYEYAVWSLQQTYPGVVSGNVYKESSTEPLTPMDYVIGVPFVGPSIKRIWRESNYGDLEKDKQAQQAKTELDAEIRLNLGENARTLFNEYSKAQGIVSNVPNWKERTSPEYKQKIQQLLKWKASSYRHRINEIRAAYEKGDLEEVNQQAEALEYESSFYLKRVRPDLQP